MSKVVIDEGLASDGYWKAMILLTIGIFLVIVYLFFDYSIIGSTAVILLAMGLGTVSSWKKKPQFDFK